MSVWYFGTDPAYNLPPLRGILVGDLPQGGPEETRRLVRGHYVAVSTTLLWGALLKPPQCPTEPVHGIWFVLGRRSATFEPSPHAEAGASG